MNPFHVLGLSEGASSADIKRAYYKLARRWHPDKNKSQEAHRKFQEINEAYKQINSQNYASNNNTRDAGHTERSKGKPILRLFFKLLFAARNLVLQLVLVAQDSFTKLMSLDPRYQAKTPANMPEYFNEYRNPMEKQSFEAKCAVFEQFAVNSLALLFQFKKIYETTQSELESELGPENDNMGPRYF